MSDVYGGPFGTYGTIPGTLTTAQKDALQASLDSMKTLLPQQEDQNTPTSAPHPDFDQIMPHTSEKLVAEIDAFAATISSVTT